MYICLLKGTNLTTFSSFPYNVCRSPRRVNNAISLLSPRILCEGNGNLSSWSFSNIYLSSGLRNIRGPWHSWWQDYMVGEEQWVILRMGTNIRRIPKRYTIWPWEVWVIHYVSVFQSDSSPQLWYRWEVSWWWATFGWIASKPWLVCLQHGMTRVNVSFMYYPRKWVGLWCFFIACIACNPISTVEVCVGLVMSVKTASGKKNAHLWERRFVTLFDSFLVIPSIQVSITDGW